MTLTRKRGKIGLTALLKKLIGIKILTYFDEIQNAQTFNHWPFFRANRMSIERFAYLVIAVLKKAIFDLTCREKKKVSTLVPHSVEVWIFIEKI